MWNLIRKTRRRVYEQWSPNMCVYKTRKRKGKKGRGIYDHIQGEKGEGEFASRCCVVFSLQPF